jgi:hypothetical protein
MRATLAFAGLYQLTHELIKDIVVPKVRFFYYRGCNETGHLYDEVAYNEQVLSRSPKSKFRSSLL